MREMLLVARHEYRYLLSKRSFLFATIGVPLGVFLLIALAILVQSRSADGRPLGLVDRSGLFPPAGEVSAIAGEEVLDLRLFSSRAAAEASLQAGEIQAYALLEPDFPDTRRATLFTLDQEPGEKIRRALRWHIQRQVLLRLPPQYAFLQEGELRYELTSLDGRRQIRSGAAIVNLFAPIIASFLLYLVLIGAGGYLVRAVAAEKENRTMEIMLTSLRPEGLIAGKTLAILAVVLTQTALWGAALFIAIRLGAPRFEALAALEIPWDFLALVTIFFLPTFLLLAGIMIAVGAAVADAGQGQQLAGFLNLLFLIPWFLIGLAMAQPNHPLLVAFSLFPFTAFLTLALRWSLTSLPFGQLLLSWTLLALSAALSLWLAGRIFRQGMLRFHLRLAAGEIWQAIKAKPGRQGG